MLQVVPKQDGIDPTVIWKKKEFSRPIRLKLVCENNEFILISILTENIGHKAYEILEGFNFKL